MATKDPPRPSADPGLDGDQSADPPPQKPRRGGFVRPADYPAKAKKIAAQLAHVREKYKNTHARRAHLQRLMDEGASVLQIRTYIHRRHWEVLLLHCAGETAKAIAEMVGVAPESVKKMLSRPELRYMERAITKAQLERVVSGEYGARAAARAAAPAAMERIIEKAGAKDGVRGADKTSDQLRAAETVLKVSGDLGGTTDAKTVTHHHLHQLMSELTVEELRALGSRGVWPKRMENTVRHLKLLPAPDASTKDAGT